MGLDNKHAYIKIFVMFTHWGYKADLAFIKKNKKWILIVEYNQMHLTLERIE